MTTVLGESRFFTERKNSTSAFVKPSAACMSANCNKQPSLLLPTCTSFTFFHFGIFFTLFFSRSLPPFCVTAASPPSSCETVVPATTQTSCVGSNERTNEPLPLSPSFLSHLVQFASSSSLPLEGGSFKIHFSQAAPPTPDEH